MKISFSDYLNEGFVGINDVETDVDIIKLALQAEVDASGLYSHLAQKANDPRVKEVLIDIQREEEEHIGEFNRVLEIIDPDYEEARESGEDEVEEMIDT